jgi:membrane protein implicated in regulation of membrane protease activity
MARVKQVRVLCNTLLVFALCALVLWLLRARLWAYHTALIWGVLLGLTGGALRWWQLYHRIARRDRRYERNKIFVNYLTIFEVIITVLFYNVYMSIPLILALITVVLLTTLSAHWWTVLGSSFGLACTGLQTACIVRYERRHGPLYYQYKSETWAGAEGLLYQEGVVVQPLIPAGKAEVGGVLWNAVSRSGEALQVGERIEVLAVERLTLYVDRLSMLSACRSGSDSTEAD